MSFRHIIISIIFFSVTLTVSAGKGFVVESVGKEVRVEWRKKLIEEALSTDTMNFGYSALQIVLDANQKEPRWRFQGKVITLASGVKSDGEFMKLLTHEIGHYVDIYTLFSRGGVDVSDDFYSISWLDKTTKKPGEWLSSFVSGYATTNKYEDFAESFTFYIFHNEDFSARALSDESLRQKYLFFREKIFASWMFVGTDFRTSMIPSYLWDTTKIPISLKKYLYSLRESI